MPAHCGTDRERGAMRICLYQAHAGVSERHAVVRLSRDEVTPPVPAAVTAVLAFPLDGRLPDLAGATQLSAGCEREFLTAVVALHA